MKRLTCWLFGHRNIFYHDAILGGTSAACLRCYGHANGPTLLTQESTDA